MALVSFLRKGCFAPVKLSWIPESLASSETGICERAPGAMVIHGDSPPLRRYGPVGSDNSSVIL